MESPLWTDIYAPSIQDLPQPSVRDRLEDAVDAPVNLLLHGPVGSGKTAAVRALAEAAHEDPESDLIEINVADFFGLTKSELADDPRFARFITPKRRRESSKADLINYVLKESAGYPPVSGNYNTILLDNAEAIREDFQQALRRVMERHHKATQFIITTRQPTKLIPPIRSRCFPVSVRAPSEDEIVAVLRDIVESEEITHDDDGLEYIASYAEGNLRKAILAAQTAAEKGDALEGVEVLEPLQDVGIDDEIAEMLEAAESGAISDARSILDDLLIDEGLTGEEVIEAILDVARTRYNGSRLAVVTQRVGQIEFDLSQGTSDRIHLSRFLAELGAGESFESR